MILKVKFCNYYLASFIAQLNLGSKRRLRYITINYNKIVLDVLKILYKEGIIRIFIIKGDKILIYYKYYVGINFFKFKIISKPSKRIY
jgi:ribosomal protein S8